MPFPSFSFQLRISITAILLVVLGGPILQGQSANSKSSKLYDEFLAPSVTSRPYVWWHWMGSNFSKEGITKDLEAMKSMGIGGATIFNIASAVQESHVPTFNNPWPEQTYRSPAYWEAVVHATKEAKRLGLELGLHNTVGYSTTGGPWVTEARSMKQLVWTKVLCKEGLKPGFEIAKPAPVVDLQGWGRKGLPPQPSTWYKDLGYWAIQEKDSLKYEKALDFTTHFDTSGRLVKPLPPGNWQVYRLGYAPTMSTPHPLPDELIGKCLEADKMSEAESEFHWNTVLEPLKKLVGPYLGNTFKHLLIDSYEAGSQNWTPAFREEFIKRKGYDPMPWLLSFTPTVTDSRKHAERRIHNTKDQTARFEWDFRDVIAQLYYERGWVVAKRKMKELGLELQFEPYEGPFNTASGAALADLPMGEFWSASRDGINGAVTAAARAAGKRIIGAEAFTGSPAVSKYTEDPNFLLPAATAAFASGVNRMVLHTWVHQPFDDQYQPGMSMGWWGSHFSRHQTWFEPGKSFFQYLARTQVMLQYGSPVSEYLCLEKNTDPQADLISTVDFLRQNIQVIKGRMVLESGRSYPFLLLPQGNQLLPEVLQKLKKLVELGGVVVGEKPVQSPSMKGFPTCDRLVKELADEVWGEGGMNRLKLGRVYESLEEARKDLIPSTDVQLKNLSDGKAIKLIHRTGAQGEVYFLANLTDSVRSFQVSFLQPGMVPYLWNAEDGSRKAIENWKEDEGRVELPLTVEPHQSVFVVFEKRSVQNGSSVVYHNLPVKTRTLVALPSSNWKLKLEPKLQPASYKELFLLQDLGQSEDKQLRYFSGTLTYTKSLFLDSSQLLKGRQLWLDFGKVEDIMSLRINQQELGVKWHPPYQYEVAGYLKPGENFIEAKVTVNWANRLVGDEQEPADFEWGPDRGSNGRAMKAYPDWFIQGKERPSTGRKGFLIWYYYRKDSKTAPAGLMGPVVLRGE